MAEGMAGHVNDLESQAEHFDAITVVQGQVARRDALRHRAEHTGAGAFLQVRHAADMVGMVMGDDDVAQLPVRMGGQPFLDGAGIARVDHRATTVGYILQ
ncbi:hypothetical protein D3C81_1397880 [compost metagenome]